MFSPADVQLTPCAVNRSPSPASPGHWWLSPQPPIINWLCRAEAFERSLLSAYAGRLFWARAALMCASTWSRIASPVTGASFGVAAGAVAVVLRGFGFAGALV